MNRIILISLLMLCVFISTSASARTTIHHYDVADVLNNPEFASRLEGVTFYFGSSTHAEPVKTFGEYRTNKKTNAFRKSDKDACEWVMLSALITLRNRALGLGANSVINVRSNFKNQLFVSDTQYACGAGGIIAGVALIGDIVTIN